MMYRGSYNTAISLQTKVDQKLGDVGAMYQRRADLVPQLVATVKGAADNEKTILTQVTNARAGISSAKTPAEMDAAGKEINNAIRAFNLVVEAYPQVRSTQNFSDLQTQLEGTENRIAIARQDYNSAVMEYNSHILGFVNSMFLNKQLFMKRDMFKESAGSEVAPKVDFEKKQ